MKRYIPILFSLFCSSYSYATWNEHFVKYTCLPEIGVFELERLSVESPNDLYDASGVKVEVIETLKGKGIYSISAGAHEYSCYIKDQSITVAFISRSYRQNWVGGVLSIKIGDKYLTKDLDFFWGIQSLSKLRINFNGLNASVSYWSNIASEDDIFGYVETDLLLPSDSLITKKDLVKKHKISAQ